MQKNPPMGAASRKFMFDTSFDFGRLRDEPEAEEPMFDTQAVEAARAQGFEEGKEAGLAAAREALEYSIEQCLATLSERVGEIGGQVAVTRETATQEAATIAVAIARKVLPALTRLHGVDEIEAIVTECLGRVAEEPRIVVRVSGEDLPGLRGRLDSIVAAGGFGGRIVLLADPEMKAGDCRVEWADGGAERDGARLWREIDAAIDNIVVKTEAKFAPPSDQKQE